MTTRELKFYSEYAAERVAVIMGHDCAAAKALADLRKRRANGERVALFQDRANNCLLVGPVPEGLAPQ